MDQYGQTVVPLEHGRTQPTYAIEGGFFSEVMRLDGSTVWTVLDEQGQFVREVPVEYDSDHYPIYPPPSYQPKERQPFQGIENVNGLYYADASGAPISQKFDWCGHVTADGQGFVGMDGKIYRIEFGK